MKVGAAVVAVVAFGLSMLLARGTHAGTTRKSGSAGGSRTALQAPRPFVAALNRDDGGFEGGAAPQPASGPPVAQSGGS